MFDIRAHINECVSREIAEFESADDTVAERLAGRARRSGGGSLVYSLRLDADEVQALELRARSLDVKPTVLARNLVRIGLHNGRHAEEILELLARVESALAELRALVA